LTTAFDETAEDRPAAPHPQAAPELFSQEQLEAHAARLAGGHRLATDPLRARALIPLVEDSGRQLDDAYRFLTTATRTALTSPSCAADCQAGCVR